MTSFLYQEFLRLKNGRDPTSVQILLKRSQWQFLRARWIIDMYEYLETEKEMIQSRFDAVGTLKAVQKNRKTCIGTRYWDSTFLLLKKNFFSFLEFFLVKCIWFMNKEGIFVLLDIYIKTAWPYIFVSLRFSSV